MRALQQELEQLREDREREQELAARRAKQDEEETQILRDRLEAVEGGISVRFLRRCIICTTHFSMFH